MPLTITLLAITKQQIKCIEAKVVNSYLKVRWMLAFKTYICFHTFSQPHSSIMVFPVLVSVWCLSLFQQDPFSHPSHHEL